MLQKYSLDMFRLFFFLVSRLYMFLHCAVADTAQSQDELGKPSQNSRHCMNTQNTAGIMAIKSKQHMVLRNREINDTIRIIVIKLP